MAEDLDDTRTWCLGRFAVDVPADFVRRTETGSVMAIEIEDLGPGTPERLARLIERRRAHLAAGHPVEDGAGVPVILSDETVQGIDLLAYAERFEALDYTSEDWTEEAHVLSEGQIFRLSAVVATDRAAQGRAELIAAASAIQPRADQQVPSGGVCVPGAVLDLPRATGVWSAVFMPDGVEGPIGLRVTIAERAPGQPRLDPVRRFDDRRARDITLAGMAGQELRRADDTISFGAIGGATPGPDGWDVTVQAEYFDQRSDGIAGSDPLSLEHATAIWQTALRSLRPRQ